MRQQEEPIESVRYTGQEKELTVPKTNQHGELLSMLSEIDLPAMNMAKSLNRAISNADLMASVINMKRKLGGDAIGDPSDIYKMLPTKLRNIEGFDILEEARLVELGESKLSSAERKLIRVLHDVYHARLHSTAITTPVKPKEVIPYTPPVDEHGVEIGSIEHIHG